MVVRPLGEHDESRVRLDKPWLMKAAASRRTPNEPNQVTTSRDDGFEWVLAQCVEKAAAGSGKRRLWLECAADKGERHGGI